MADEIISRAEAQARGLKRYFSGKRCPKNHIAERRTSNHECLECIRASARIRSRQQRANNRNGINARKREQYASNAEEERVKACERRAKNRDEINARRREQRAGNPEQARVRDREHYASHRFELGQRAVTRRLISPEEMRAKERERYAKNRDKRVSAERVRRAKHREKINAQRRDRHAKNPLKARVQQATRRAFKHAAGGIHTAQDIREIYELQHGKCAYCRLKLKDKYHIDHIMPIKLGGSNDRKNLQLTCGPRCNSAKGAKDPIDFARELGRLL